MAETDTAAKRLREWSPSPRQWLAALLVLVLLCVWVVWAIFTSHATNEPNRRALLQLHSRLELGDDLNTVERRFRAVATPHLRFRDGAQDEYWITMPVEFGASDWRLQVEFDGGRASAVKMRTLDGPKPDGSPPDKVRVTQGQAKGRVAPDRRPK